MPTNRIDTVGLAKRVVNGDKRAVARAISLVENRDPVAEELLKLLFPHTGRAQRIGITGPPGVGKSSLTSGLVSAARAQDKSVGVISVDPSSPFTQGALLGDRIRLSEHFLDSEVFIRSMGSRGHLGGLAESTVEASLVLDAAGKDVIFIETVGVGQSEIEVVTISDTVVLVLMPGSGDSIQALKAGVMEIPDIIVVNKKDHPQAEQMIDEVYGMLCLKGQSDGWIPPVLGTQAQTGEGVPELWEQIEAHIAQAKQNGAFHLRRERQLEQAVMALAVKRMAGRLQREAHSNPELAGILRSVAERNTDPLSAVRLILTRVFGVRDEEV
ncbi:MAG: methylmalonyl Co-A mutase-associated GTPase MeaB [Actinobacteria bacterium]|nr:methylmalonyl Co-A mutase-associated GTPase MeaB [Actinomycetota bacterium]